MNRVLVWILRPANIHSAYAFVMLHNLFGGGQYGRGRKGESAEAGQSLPHSKNALGSIPRSCPGSVWDPPVPGPS